MSAPVDQPSQPRNPLLEMFQIAGPTVATMTSYTVMQFVDKWMVSKIGPDPIYVGAQGNGGLASFVPIAIAMGFITVVNTYVAQNMGAGKPERAPAYPWNGIWMCMVYWACILVPFAFVLPMVFDAFGHEPERALLATQYGRILLLGACFTLATRAISQFFYGMHRAGIVLLAGVVANIINLVLAYVLVFGKFGLPKLGVPGSAYATVIATAVELAIPMALFLGPRLNSLYHTRAAWRPSLPHMRDLLRIGWPAGLMFGNEMICWGFFMVYLVSHFGAEHATAGWIAHQYMSLSFMPAVGISVACTALVGKYMGMGRPDIAAKRAWLGLYLALAYMGVCAVCFVVFREPMVRLFIEKDTPPDVADNLVRLGSAFLIATACFQIFDAIAMTLSGALRGAGDTVVVGIVTVGLSWGVIVGGGLAMIHYVPGLGSLGPWIAAAAYITLLALVILARFLSGKWKSIKLLDRPEAKGLTAPPELVQPALTTDGIV